MTILDLAVAPRPGARSARRGVARRSADARGRPRRDRRAMPRGYRAPGALPRSQGSGTDYLDAAMASKARGDRAAAYGEALAAVEQAALDEAAARDRALLQELLDAFANRNKCLSAGARVGARLRGSPARGARPSPRRIPRSASASSCASAKSSSTSSRTRTRSTPRLSNCLRTSGDRCCFFVGDEFQSIYGFRHADVAVFRASGARRRDTLLSAHEQLPLAAGGARDGRPPLRLATSAASSRSWTAAC